MDENSSSKNSQLSAELSTASAIEAPQVDVKPVAGFNFDQSQTAQVNETTSQTPQNTATVSKGDNNFLIYGPLGCLIAYIFLSTVGFIIASLRFIPLLIMLAIFSLSIIITEIVVFVKQTKYLRYHAPELMQSQKLILIITLVFLVGAIYLPFTSSEVIDTSDIGSVFYISLYITLSVYEMLIIWLSFCNSLFIAGKFSTKALKNIKTIFYTIAWIGVILASFVTWFIVETLLRPPNEG